MTNTGTVNGSWKMIPVTSLLYDIYEMLPDPEMQDEDRIEELLIQGSNKLLNHKFYERVFCMRVIEDYKTEMPSDYLTIRSVLGKAYNCNSKSYVNDITNDSSVTNNNVLQLVNGVSDTPSTTLNTVNIDYDYSINLRDSETIKKLVDSTKLNWKPLYPGTSIIQKLHEELNRLKQTGCLNNDETNVSSHFCEKCKHLYSVDMLGRLITTMETGLVLVEYLRTPRDSEGNRLVPYHHDLQDALNAYVLYKLFARKFNQSREHAGQKMQYWQQQWQMYYLNVKNSLLMPNLMEQLKAIHNRDMIGTNNISNVISDGVMNSTINF
jgi:hypothetical protein